jgi:hypothetical protein
VRLDGPNLYTYVRQNQWTLFAPHGLSDVNVMIYDGKDLGGPGRTTGTDFARFAKESGAEIRVDAQNLKQGVTEMQKQLQ